MERQLSSGGSSGWRGSYPQEARQGGEAVILRRLVRVERQLSSGGSSRWRGSYPQEARVQKVNSTCRVTAGINDYTVEPP